MKVLLLLTIYIFLSLSMSTIGIILTFRRIRSSEYDTIAIPKFFATKPATIRSSSTSYAILGL